MEIETESDYSEMNLGLNQEDLLKQREVTYLPTFK